MDYSSGKRDRTNSDDEFSHAKAQRREVQEDGNALLF
jgi:hypothetical protein